MEKLIELLNEYQDGMVSRVKEYVEEFGVFVLNTEQMIEEEIIISKSFGFIKWLVDNDKIDYEEYADEWRDSNVADNADFFNLSMRYNVYESLLMVLAIQDNPIEFLISILK